LKRVHGEDEKQAENDWRYQAVSPYIAPLSSLAETLSMPLAEIVFCVVREFLTIPPPGSGLVGIQVRFLILLPADVTSNASTSGEEVFAFQKNASLQKIVAGS
jgi:hypothetical protein